jgi:ribosomal protein L37E
MLLIKLKTFIRSLLFHIWAGSPKSTSAEILHRHTICMECDQFNHSKSECNICGCSISKKKRFLNKLAWADQECPLNKWNKIQRG